MNADDHGKQYPSLAAVLAARRAGEIEELTYMIDRQRMVMTAKGCDLPILETTLEELSGELLSWLGVEEET